MKSYYKIALLLLYSIFITIFVSPILAGIIPIHLYKLMGRIVLVSAFLLFFYYGDKLGFQNFRELGFEFNKKWWLLLFTGFLFGVGSVGLISGIMLHSSIRFIIPDILSIDWLRYLITYMITGFLVALIEETFFRGFILQSLLKDTKISIALIITNIFYSVVHFLKPEVTGKAEVLSLSSSINAVPLFFKPLIYEFHNLWPSILGLFLVGVVLSVAYIRVRQLSLPIGFHAGWILGIKSLSLGTDVTTSGSLWVSGNIVIYPLTWLVLIVFVLILSWHPRRKI